MGLYYLCNIRVKNPKKPRYVALLRETNNIAVQVVRAIDMEGLVKKAIEEGNKDLNKRISREDELTTIPAPKIQMCTGQRWDPVSGEDLELFRENYWGAVNNYNHIV